jgi:hypothetical protein
MFYKNKVRNTGWQFQKSKNRTRIQIIFFLNFVGRTKLWDQSYQTKVQKKSLNSVQYSDLKKHSLIFKIEFICKSFWAHFEIYNWLAKPKQIHDIFQTFVQELVDSQFSYFLKKIFQN